MKRPGLSDVIGEILHQVDGESISIGTLVERLGKSSAYLVMVLLALPMLVPMPPGVSGLIGPLICLVAGQQLLGRELWLPDRLARVEIPTVRLRSAGEKARQWLGRMEGLPEPALPTGLSFRTVAVLALWVIFIDGAVLALPIPFANTIPAVLIILMSIGLSARRLGLVLVGVTGSLLLVGVIVAALVLLGTALFESRYMRILKSWWPLP